MRNPLFLGHRGARAFRHIPENTLESFELCLQQGCDGFEFDVRCSSDGQGVVCHDPDFRGMLISGSSAQQLGLPTLYDVLRRFARCAFLDIELKVAWVERQTLDALREFPPQKGYVVSSFLPEVLATIHGMDAAVTLGLLCESRPQLGGWRDFSGEWIIPRHDLVDEELVASVHAAGKKIMVWTVNRAERMRLLADWGVDAIISDETEILCSPDWRSVNHQGH
jgi:glycerophosphoryl diester phosphodiesterase